MGQGDETKTRPEPSVEIQERGEIFFFYRPKVQKEQVHGEEDVQRLYLVLRPESGEKPVEEKQDPESGKEGSKPEPHHGDTAAEGGHGSQKIDIEKQPLLRLILMGRKSLPNPAKKGSRGRPYWGFVELVTTKIDDIKSALKGEDYDTATRGHRHQPGARAAGEGVYRILRHNVEKRMHTHLVYKLEYPEQGGAEEVQEALNITREASFLIQIKNPDQGGGGSSGFRGLKSKRRAAFPAHMQGLFGRKRYCAADPPDFLNYEGCEFLLISASDDIEEELGLELKGEEHEEEEEKLEECCDLIKMFGESSVPVKPLIEGTWV